MNINKIFGIGFHKTGTKSLASAFRKLGYKCCAGVGIHEENLQENIYEMAFSMVEKYDAFQDNPWPILYKELDLKFPNSKFILTVRDTENWIKSLVNHCKRRKTPMRKWIYGKANPLGNEKLYIRRYEQHNQEVIEYFKDRPESLLIMDITKGEGWEKLCPFLGKEIPQVEFPVKNKGAYKNLEKKAQV